ncbi:hypothetical protein BCV70DRAFT_200043 [Testicularia cyperi]|uniref:Uncharacterized protein n=1 Tax=Testicularia cyperi TaxID=1882483 RepID=A0A317XRR2_9BASI|nr:hypothetical protein BCV70DRAFT_200043 [Testicularia cyperi]
MCHSSFCLRCACAWQHGCTSLPLTRSHACVALDNFLLLHAEPEGRHRDASERLQDFKPILLLDFCSKSHLCMTERSWTALRASLPRLYHGSWCSLFLGRARRRVDPA